MKKKGAALIVLAMIVLLAVAGFSGYKVYSIHHGYKVAAEAYEAISQEYMSVDEAASTTTESQEQESTSANPQKEADTVEKTPLKVDFDGLLRDTNKEIVAWIWGPDTVINYPIAQHADNNYYLNTGINGSPSSSGAIFLEYSNFSDFSDRNNIIHGHHMNDGSMFESLKRWQDEAYYQDHPVFYLNTVYGGNYKVEVFAAFTTVAKSEAYKFEFTGDFDFMEWVEWIDQQSQIHPNLNILPTDHFLTMSTCAYATEDSRTVLIGRMLPMQSG